jgi:hypothetical protein
MPCSFLSCGMDGIHNALENAVSMASSSLSFPSCFLALENQKRNYAFVRGLDSIGGCETMDEQINNTCHASSPLAEQFLFQLELLFAVFQLLPNRFRIILWSLISLLLLCLWFGRILFFLAGPCPHLERISTLCRGFHVSYLSRGLLVSHSKIDCPCISHSIHGYRAQHI